MTRTALALCIFAWLDTSHAAPPNPLSFEVRLETVIEHDDGKFLWYHPRAAPVASGEALMTIQKHLNVSDYYSGLFTMRRRANGTWSGPTEIPELAWRPQADGTTISVADVTPGWHAKARRFLAIGCEVPYSKAGEQLDERPRQHQTVVAICDPRREQWSSWKRLEMPPETKFDFCRNACGQWVVRKDGRILLPVYFGPNTREPFSSTVVMCSFDGQSLRYLQHGAELRLAVARGLYEPSLIEFKGRWFLTLRNDVKGYVTSSRDGLNYDEPKPWTFDDGAELGSANTQQHWLAHSEGLFLVYTRSGAGNDHIPRNRAPLFMAEVDADRLVVKRATERIIIPERGGELGNFGATAMSRRESWVTVSEGIWSEDARRRGARGATFVAHIVWSRRNRLAPFAQ